MPVLTILSELLADCRLLGILVGDFNVVLLSPLSSVQSFCDALMGLGFISLLRQVIHPASSSCLDHVWTSNDSSTDVTDLSVLDCLEFSDHYPVVLSVSFFRSVLSQDSRTWLRSFGARNYGRLYFILSTIDWSSLYANYDVDAA